MLLGFLSNDPACTVVLGSLYSSKHPPAQGLTAENNVKSIVTRCKAKLEFNDEDKVITALRRLAEEDMAAKESCPGLLQESRITSTWSG